MVALSFSLFWGRFPSCKSAKIMTVGGRGREGEGFWRNGVLLFLFFCFCVPCFLFLLFFCLYL